MPEQTVGKVSKYFGKVGVAAVDMEGTLKVGDTVHFHGATTDFTQVVESMQEEHQSITEAKPGMAIGIKVKERVRPGDKVLVVSD